MRNRDFPGLRLASWACGAVVLGALAAGCGPSDTGGSGAAGGSSGSGGSTTNTSSCIAPGDDDQKTVVTALVEAKDGDTICFTEGTFKFTGQLDLDAANVTLIGAGMDKTIWDFSGQTEGTNGLQIRGDGCTVEELKVLNTAGQDGIRAEAVDGITFRKVAVIWEADASMESGAYGLYPVGSTNVLIEQSEVKGARDAGVYVGQSTNVLIKDNDVHGNVAGIEIENTTDSEVVGNHAYENTAGILAFNLPNLPVQDGKRAKIHDNLVENNNSKNFGVEGQIVAKVPHGIGIMILASDDNEIHNNDVKGNNTVGILVVSYLEFLFGPPNDPMYDPFPQGNWTHDNTFTDNGNMPNILVAGAFPNMDMPDIGWDGCMDPNAVDDGMLINCISNNIGDGGGPATYGNGDLCNMPSMVSTDPAPVTCEYEALPPQ